MQPDSSIGTGKLFGRPTPAQLLKAGKSIKDGWSHAGEGADDPASTPAQNNNSVEDLDRTNVPKEDDQGFVSAGKESHDYGEVQIGKLYAISEERELASEARHSEDGLEVYPEANSTTDSSQESNATGTIPAHPLDQPGLKSVSFDISQVNEIHCEPQSEAVKTPMKLGAGVDDVLFWLRSIGFSQYEKTFALNRIDFEELFRLKENDLKQMGISIKQNRRLLLEAIEYLRLSLRLQQASNGKDARPNWYLPEIDNAEEQKPVSKTDDKNIPAQKKGYVTWLDATHRKSYRGYAIIQGASLHIFKSSEHIFLKPSVSVPLQSALIAFSSLAQNCILIQADLSIPSKDDLYLVADSKREAQEWLNQLNAASNVQISQSSSMIAVSSIKTYHIKLNCLFVQNPANLCKPFLSIGLVDKNGNLVSELNRFDIEPSHDVESKSELSSDNTLSVKLQGEITVSRKMLQTVGQGAVIFFEIKGSSQKQAVIFPETHYWTFALVSELNNGPTRLNLRKKPVSYDPLILRSSTNMKQMSFLAIDCFVKDAAKKQEDKSTSTGDSFAEDDWRTIVELAAILKDKESSSTEKIHKVQELLGEGSPAVAMPEGGEQSTDEMIADDDVQAIPVGVSTACPHPSQRLQGIKVMHLLYSDAENPLPPNDVKDLNNLYSVLDTEALEQMFSVKREVLTEAILEGEKRFLEIIDRYNSDENSVLRFIKDCDISNTPKNFVIDLCEGIMKNFEPLMSSGAKLDPSLQDKLSTRLFKIPFVYERCEAMVYCLNFEDEYLRLRSDLKTLRTLTTGLSSSNQLRKFFLHLLAIANFLNYENAGGLTVSFYVDNLKEILETRTNVLGKSLIDVLVEHLLKKDPEVLQIVDLLPPRSKEQLNYHQASEMCLALLKGFRRIYSYIQLQSPRGSLSKFVVSNRIREKLDELVLALNAYKCCDSDHDKFWRHFGINHTSPDYVRTFCDLRGMIEAALEKRSSMHKAGKTEPLNEIETGPIEDDTPLMRWLRQNGLEMFRASLEAKNVTLEGLKKSSKMDFLDDSVSLRDKKRFQKALNVLRKEAAKEKGESVNYDAHVVQVHSDLMFRGGKKDTIVQKKEFVEGWLSIKFKNTRSYEQVYVKITRNLMTLHNTDESSDSQSNVCLDGAAIIDLDSANELEIRMNLFEQSRHDFRIRAENPAHTQQWKQALSRASIWKASQAVLDKAKVRSTAKEEETRRLFPGGSARELLQGPLVRPPEARRKEVKEDRELGDWSLSIELVEVQTVPLKGTSYQSPSICIKCAGVVGKKLIVESVCQEVFIPHEADSRSVMSIRSSRRFQIPEHLRGADELHVCFELHHQKPNKRSIKAWTSIRYSHIVPGRTVLDMWLKPVQYVRSSAKSTKSTGFQLTIDVKKPH